MADKTTFTPEEWKALLESVMMAGMAVTAAEPSGLWGLIKEGLSSGWALLEAKQSPTPLVKAIADDYATSEGRSTAREELQADLRDSEVGEIRAKALAALREAAAIVDAKAGADAGPFKAWLHQIAQKTADAAGEGVFGFGGEKVSERERATLAEIAQALGLGAGSGSGTAAV